MIVAAIPLKRLSEAKSRLAGHLLDEERTRLVTDLVERTVTVLRTCSTIECVALATPETQLGERLGVEVLPDRGSLNRAIEDAQRWATTKGADALLVVPADLPLLNAGDIECLLSSMPPRPSLTIAPTRDGGTGGLLLCPPDVVSPAYGPQSFTHHRSRGEGAGAALKIVLREGFAAEMDTIEDLKMHGLHLP